MQYRVLGDTMPAVEVLFDAAGEGMYTQSGGMAWMTEGVEMSTNTKGGLMKGLGRMFAGESLFMATYRAQKAGAMIAFASTVAGRILPVDVSQGGLVCQKGAFLCAQESVNLDITFTKKFSAGLFGGEGFVLQRYSGQGLAFLDKIPVPGRRPRQSGFPPWGNSLPSSPHTGQQPGQKRLFFFLSLSFSSFHVALLFTRSQ